MRLGGVVGGGRRLVMEGEETEFWVMKRGRCSPVTPAEELEEDDWSRSEITCTTPIATTLSMPATKVKHCVMDQINGKKPKKHT